jgi:hypothetical protein
VSGLYSVHDRMINEYGTVGGMRFPLAHTLNSKLIVIQLFYLV